MQELIYYGPPMPKGLYPWPDLWGYLCPSCGDLVHRTQCWLDNDGLNKHYACLSPERLAQVKGE